MTPTDDAPPPDHAALRQQPIAADAPIPHRQVDPLADQGAPLAPPVQGQAIDKLPAPRADLKTLVSRDQDGAAHLALNGEVLPHGVWEGCASFMWVNHHTRERGRT